MNLMQCWLTDAQVPQTLQTPQEVARWELDQLKVDCSLTVQPELGDAFEILDGGHGIRGGDTGILYGVYRLLEHRREGSPPPQGVQTPAFSLRMIDHWDNMSGNIERGYAGRSIFFANDDFRGDDKTLRAYARLLASVGINVICLNNVNVAPPAQELIGERFLPDVAQVAAIFKPFGIRLLLSVDYAMPVPKRAGHSRPAGRIRAEVVGRACKACLPPCAKSLRIFSQSGLGIPPRPLYLWP